MQFQNRKFVFVVLPLAFAFAYCQSTSGQVDLKTHIKDFETDSKKDRMNTTRLLASLVIREEVTKAQREQILTLLRGAVGDDSPEVRLTTYVEILKISLAENDFELGKFAFQATEDKNLNVNRQFLTYFRTFYSKRYSSGKDYTDILKSKLSDEDLDIRFQSAMTLHSWGISNNKILDILIESLELSNYRSGIIYALTSDKTNRDKTVANIVNRLSKSDDNAGTYINVLSLLAPDANYSMPLILEQFASDQPQIRAAVVTAIGRMKTLKERSLQILSRAIEDEVAIVRRRVIPSLVQLEPEPAVLKNAVVKLLRDKESSVAEMAAATISQFENNFEFLLGDLRPILQNGEYHELMALLGGLSNCGPLAGAAAQDVAKVLGHENLDVRTRACWALAAISIDKQLVIDSINNSIANEKDVPVIMAAVQMLDEIPATDPVTKVNYLKYLQHEDEFVRLFCVSGLKAYKDPELVGQLIKVKRDPNKQYGQNPSQIGIEVVATIVDSGQKAIQAAAQYLNDPDSMIQCRALRIAAHSDPPIPGFKQRLLAALKNKSPEISYCGAVAASNFKDVDAEILDAMFDLTSPNYRQKTVNILNLFGSMGSRAAAITPRIATLVGGAYRNRFTNDAKRILVQLGKHAEPAIGELISGPFNPNKLECLAAIGVKNAEAELALRKYLELLQQNSNSSKNIRAIANNRRNSMFASAALSQVSDDKQTATRIILKELNGDYQAVALSVVGRLDAPAPSLVDAISDLLPNKAAIATLTDIGPAATEAVDRLTELLGSPDREVANLVGHALSSINGDPNFAINVVDRILDDNRFQPIDIKVEQRQILWSLLRFLQRDYAQDPAVTELMNKLQRCRFSNLRSFVKGLKNQA